MVIVDCRRCRWFKNIEDMSDSELEESYVFIEKYRPGEKLLGWCNKFRRPVTRYRGRCRGYTPRHVVSRRLDEFINIKLVYSTGNTFSSTG